MNYERAAMLMHVIVEAGKHGPLYTKLAGWAGEDLKKMIDDEDKNRITPEASQPGQPMTQQEAKNPQPRLPQPEDRPPHGRSYTSEPAYKPEPTEPVERKV